MAVTREKTKAVCSCHMKIICVMISRTVTSGVVGELYSAALCVVQLIIVMCSITSSALSYDL